VHGIGNLGQTFYILDPEQSVGNQIIEMNFSKNLTTPQMTRRLPDNLLYTSNQKCYLQPISVVANNVKDFQQKFTEKFGFTGGLYSDDVRWAYMQMEFFNRSVAYSEI
jgi:hypothetical protein